MPIILREIGVSEEDTRERILKNLTTPPLVATAPGRRGGFRGELDDLVGPGVDAYYLPETLRFIAWDFPNVVYPGIDIDYKLTGYDWFNTDLQWTVDSGPAGMTIDPDGTLHCGHPQLHGRGPGLHYQQRRTHGDNTMSVETRMKRGGESCLSC